MLATVVWRQFFVGDVMGDQERVAGQGSAAGEPAAAGAPAGGQAEGPSCLLKAEFIALVAGAALANAGGGGKIRVSCSTLVIDPPPFSELMVDYSALD